jgi:hypothetical protein
MPYDLPFERIAGLTNEAAFEQNKSVAAELIAAFPEIHDLNQADSSAYFMHRELDLEDEFPEKHFSLYAEIEDMWFSFQFWKDVLWLELGARGDINIRFAQVRRYAAIIMQQGFKIYPPHDGNTSVDEGIAWHLQEYIEWVGFVEHITKTIAAKNPSAE